MIVLVVINIGSYINIERDADGFTPRHTTTLPLKGTI